MVQMRVCSLLALGALWIVAVDCSNCSSDLTSLEDIRNSFMENTTALPLNDWINTTQDFLRRNWVQWIFPNLNFSCAGNISRFIVRAEETNYTMNSPPYLSIWRRILDVSSSSSYNQIYSINVSGKANFEPSENENSDIFYYTLHQPLSVEAGDVIGLELMHGGRESHRIVFLNSGERNSPISYHKAFKHTLFSVPPQPGFMGSNTSAFTPLVGVEFVQNTVSPPPPTPSTLGLETTSTPSSSSTNLTPLTTSSTAGPSVNVGLISGVILGVLLLAVITLLAVMVVLVVQRKRRSQQKICEVPTEPGPPTLTNPMYQDTGVGHGVQSAPQTAILERTGNSYHVYATPSESPVQLNYLYPSPEAHSTVEKQNHHYEFSEDYCPTRNGVRYKMESTLPQRDQPIVKTQPYEVPVTALQFNQDKSKSPSLAGNREHIYSVLEEGIYVPTEEERQIVSTSVSQPISTSQASLVDDPATSLSRFNLYATLSMKYEGGLRREEFFKQEEIYWRPASNKRGLYGQLAERKYREIVRKQINITRHLGSGQFGTVQMGVWQTSQDSLEVAVKTLQPMATEEDKVKFLQEAAIMGQFLHPNVIKLYGVVTVGEPVMIVLEYMHNGDLRNYLLSKRPPQGELKAVPDDLPNTLLRFCREISAGMNYLANKAFVHRDLAARNILLSAETTCKIGDFGMSRDLEQNSYYITHGGIIPVKWTSPEAINYKKYSTASDVWSFGCVMYEIWSLGHKPFEGYSNLQCMQLISKGLRLAPPPGCSRPMYELMIRCWHSESSGRPTFSAIFNELSHSPSHLISWSIKDLDIHPLVDYLGAPLETSEDLYPDLQDYYTSKQYKGMFIHGSRTADW